MNYKKLYLTAAILSVLLACSACGNTVTADGVPTVTATPVPTATFAPTVTATPNSTATIALTPTATPAPTATNTPMPTATPVPTATSTPLPTATSTPLPTVTPAPTATSTPAPTATSTPIPTATPTPTPTATSTPTPAPTATPTVTPMPTAAVSKGLPELTYKENTIIEDTLFSSEEEVNQHLFSMVLNNFYKFGILVDDLSLLHSEEEYLALFPEFISIEFESLTKYHNGYYLCISDLVTTQTDIALRYAVRTGDTSVLQEAELQTYQKLFAIAEELNLAELSDIDAVLAVHDYLVLNTAYDTATAATGSGGPAHYASGTLLNGLAVCSGYASSFRLLMILADIPCEYVFTDTHAWNLVQLEDNWYHIDVTWDDPTPDREGVVIYTHFMLTDADISRLEDHGNWTCECKEAHNCDDESYRLYPYSNYMCATEEEALTLIHSQTDNALITFVYPVESALTEDSLLQLTARTLGISGSITYYPAELLGTSHYLLQVVPAP